MKQGVYFKRVLLMWLCAALLCLAPVWVDSAAAADVLAGYRTQAKELSEQLDTQAPQANLLTAFNDLYKNGEYEGAYEYYQANKGGMISSCWAMNNVGLAMLQLQKNEEALVLYLAIQYKAQ